MKLREEYLIGDSGAKIIEFVQRAPSDGRWTAFEPEVRTGLCLLRSGGFYREAEGQQEFVDTAIGHFVRAGVEERFRHPGMVTYHYTLIELGPEIFAAQVEGADSSRGWALPTTAALDMRHRELLAACALDADPFERSELLHLLLEELPPRAARPGPSIQPTTQAVHHRLVTSVQEALSQGHLNAGLEDLARMVDSSPHHLSRIFRRATGYTLTAYRTQLRIRAVLEDLTASKGTLAELAATHGFADHAHLTRTLRRYHGEAPSALRVRLAHRQ